MSDGGDYPGMSSAAAAGDYPGAGSDLPENPPGGNTAGDDARSPAIAGNINTDAAGSDCSGAGRELAIERTPASSDTDTLTRQTIAKMTEHIRADIYDPGVQMCMSAAIEKLGRGRRDPFSCAWAVFWFLKHRVKRASDEAALFRLGEPDQADMLIAPSLLLQMRDAAEDCDGFTMCAAAMLAYAGIENCLVTVACDPRDPKRWSHVFGMVRMKDGTWMPLDCSHGNGPGWMVPPGRIYRWQAWDLGGNAIDAKPTLNQRLNGYVNRAGGRRGMGDDLSDVPLTTVEPGGIDPSLLLPPSATDPNLLDTSAPGSFLQFGAPSSGTNWGSFFASLFGNAAKVATVAELPAGSTLLPNGTVVGSGQTIPGSSSSLLLIGGLALAAVLVISMAGKGK